MVMGYQEKSINELEDVMNKWIAFVGVGILAVVVTLVSFAQEGVVVTDSGLTYEDIEIGTGATAEVGKTAVIHLTGWLDDQGQKGEKFICTRDLGKPVSFRLGTKRVMQGWNIGVEGMKVGGKRRLMIPSASAYGAKGVDDVVPPNADLIFDVELLGVR